MLPCNPICASHSICSAERVGFIISKPQSGYTEFVADKYIDFAPAKISTKPPKVFLGGFLFAVTEDLQKCYSFFFFCVIMVKILLRGEFPE